jgi:hypothetical protein
VRAFPSALAPLNFYAGRRFQAWSARVPPENLPALLNNMVKGPHRLPGRRGRSGETVVPWLYGKGKVPIPPPCRGAEARRGFRRLRAGITSSPARATAPNRGPSSRNRAFLTAEPSREVQLLQMHCPRRGKPPAIRWRRDPVSSFAVVRRATGQFAVHKLEEAHAPHRYVHDVTGEGASESIVEPPQKRKPRDVRESVPRIRHEEDFGEERSDSSIRKIESCCPREKPDARRRPIWS